ncbi:MAG TPA: tetratricopeptide repeat protein [Candidatus Limnocylindria bacterium]|nr:tetratricopeptide repeat protein [Candidatus Limnocylindria bacterium]
MKYLALFTLALALFLTPTSNAQEISGPPAQPPAAPTTNPTATNVPAMTPLQSAELRGDVLMARKEFAQAVDSYGQVLSERPNDALVLNKVGVAYQQLGDLQRSSRYYKKAMKADKNFPSPINNLGSVEYEKKHYGKAISLYKRAAILKVDLSVIYSNLGYAYFANKQYPEATDSFGKALALDPTIFEHKGGYGSIIQQRTTTDPGLFYFFVAQSFASAGDAERAAHYLKLARDDGYTKFRSAETDPAFARVIKDPRVQEVLQVVPEYMNDAKKNNLN